MAKHYIVIGAGVVGLSTAYHLLSLGHRVTILEKESKARGASVRNFGMIWPIGQPLETYYETALSSRSTWYKLARHCEFEIENSGSLHLAYHIEEQSVLEEFIQKETKYRNINWLTPEKTIQTSPTVKSQNLKGSMMSRDECIVDPRKAIFQIAHWLDEQPNCTIHYNSCITMIQENACYTFDKKYEADKIFICTGRDIDLLFPEYLKNKGVLCELQMMRTGIQPNHFRLGPSICGGLTLLHYGAFNKIDALKDLKSKIESEHKPYLDHGIHVMASQNQAGEITIGDSHQYATSFDPFIDDSINQLILEYLNSLCSLPSGKIESYWKGVYYKSTLPEPFLIESVTPYCTVINCFGGAGMTLAFGIIQDKIDNFA